MRGRHRGQSSKLGRKKKNKKEKKKEEKKKKKENKKRTKMTFNVVFPTPSQTDVMSFSLCRLVRHPIHLMTILKTRTDGR